MAEGRLPKIALKWMPKQKRAWGRPKRNWMEGIKKAMNERNLNEGQWEDRKQWSLGVRQRRKSLETDRYIHTEPDTIRLQLYSITEYHRMLSLSFLSNNCASPCEQHPPNSCDLCWIELGGTKVKPFIRCNNVGETFSLNWSCEMP
jgi:hypothetical protein